MFKIEGRHQGVDFIGQPLSEGFRQFGPMFFCQLDEVFEGFFQFSSRQEPRSKFLNPVPHAALPLLLLCCVTACILVLSIDDARGMGSQ